MLRTQRDQGENIRSFSRNLNLITRSLRRADDDLRGTLQDTPAAVREVDQLLNELEPTLPVLLGNAVSIDQVVVSHLPGLEQLLVTYPRVIGSGFTGTPDNNGGRVNLQFANKVQPCTKGYMPNNQWRRGDDLSDAPIYPAQCDSPAPYNMRGTKYAPGGQHNPASQAACTARRTTRAPDWPRARSTPRATPYDSSIRGTCRFWEGIRGSGSWWGRWRHSEPGARTGPA